MPSPEHGGYQPPEELHQPEQEPIPYLRAATFPAEPMSQRAYTRAERAIFARPDSDVSVYRVRLRRIWHVAVLGLVPPPELATQLETILATGAPATLPPEIVAMLVERRAQMTQLGPWVELRGPLPED